jgi:flagella basal body P-ring formation protein FlgA
MIGSILIILSMLISSPDILNEKINEILAKKLSGYSSYKFEILQAPTGFKHFELQENLLKINGNTAYLPAAFMDKNNRTSNSYLTIGLKLYQPVFISNKKIEKNMEISLTDFTVEEVEVGMVKGTPVLASNELKEFKSKIQINPGSILLREYINQVPAIKAGDKIIAVVVNGHIKITIEAFARQDGLVGDDIRIITSDKKQFKAKVIDSKNVTIIE